MRILGLIPARGGSKGVPNKNIKLLGGKPLLQYTSEVALKSKNLKNVVLSSDSELIIEVGKKLGLEVPFIRPTDLAEDKSPTLPVILHALEHFENKGIYFDAVCLLQVTSPFRTLAFVEKAIETFIEKETDSLISVLEIPHEYNPHWAFTETKEGNLSIATGDKTIIPQRQKLPKAYYRDGSIYITKTSVLKEQNTLFGDSISYIESSKENHVNIDTVEDWERAEKIVKNL
ncbi:MULTISPECIES: acylneuraminate cytidylyltransferase family protein [Tenacibaculum]|uniref:acylneuraminate cytidylyltransferase family protein n=1 Tax=Tenacibaculum TaxID=104267 RepID=UPI001F0ACB71|nr:MULTISPECIES: acylneuraminate cytidylyltransferase family protein [Tenacibaculum]MCH3881944.1 acylneuraminate cytidylyltransferase family protein [Tenacibaculum aquimarinum]MDO6600697.1 acylneuraminate cytidylyltransferase family protein [Tenacibaculum sp. 1_MG-2023]